MISEALKRKIVVCLGSGGVGKTTTAAVLGIQAAVEGKKALVLTIDPARRLRSALGIPEIGNFESMVNPALFEQAGIPIRGEFHAMMLDTKSAFDDVIQRIAPDEVTIRAIFENRIYHYVSTTLAGSREYVAAERLYDIYRRGMYDIIIVDTPPTNNALDFLEGPSRMSRFLDDRIMRLFLVSGLGEGGIKEALVRRTSAVIFRLMAIVFGREFVSELSDLIFNFRDMYGEFHRRASELDAILRSKDVAFLVITSPDKTRIHESAFLSRKLAMGGYNLYGVLVNRINTAAEGGWNITMEEVEKFLIDNVPGVDTEIARQAAGMMNLRFGELREEAAMDREVVGLLSSSIGEDKLYIVPCFNTEICDLKSLDMFRKTLFMEKTEVCN